MLIDEIFVISGQPASAPQVPISSIVPNPVSYFLGVSRGITGEVLIAAADSRGCTPHP